MFQKNTYKRFIKIIKKHVFIPFLIFNLLFFNIFTVVVQCQEIIIDGKTATNINVNGNITDITTDTIRQNTAFNSFYKFNIDAGNIVNLYLPDGTEKLINTISGSASQINGILNSIKNGDIGGNVFFLNPHDIMVGKEGSINVGSLTAVTPTMEFMDKIFTSPYNPSDSAINSILNGSIPISRTGLITVAGKINAVNDINIKASDIDIESPAVITTAAVFSEESGVNTDKISFSDVVNINGIERGTRIAHENGNIIIEAVNDINSSGIIAADGADNLDAGSVTLIAGNSVNLNSGSEILARGTGNNSVSGDINIKAVQENDVFSESGVVEAGAEINIEGAVLKGKNISLLTSSSAIFNWDPSNSDKLPVGAAANIDSILTDVDAAQAIVSVDSGINIKSGSILEASDKVELKAVSGSELIWESNAGDQLASIGLIYSNIESNAVVNVHDGAAIRAENLELSAINDTLLNVETLAQTTSQDSTGQIALALSFADINSLAKINSGADINVRGDINISAVNQNSFKSKASALTSAGYAGIAANFLTVNSRAEAVNAADINNINNLVIEALDLTTENHTEAEAKAASPSLTQKYKLEGSNAILDFIEKKIGEQQEEDEDNGAAVKPRLAGAINIVNTDYQAIARIADDTEIKASGDVVLSSRVIDNGVINRALSEVASKARDSASPQDPNASISLSAAVIYGNYNHSADAYTGNNSLLEAGRVGISAQTIQPYEFTWHKYEGIDSIIEKLKNIKGDLGLSDYLTGYANSEGKAENLALAGSVSLLKFTNNTNAYTGTNSIINILGSDNNQEWTPVLAGQRIIDEKFDSGSFLLTMEAPVTIKAVNDIGGVFAAGNINSLLNPAGVGSESGASAGGAYNHPVYYNNTRAYVSKGTQIQAISGEAGFDLVVIAKSREKMISIAPSAGSGSGYGLNGMIALTGINSLTTASIDDEARINVRNLKINAEDEVLAWSLAGAVNSSKALGAGIGVAINDIKTDTRAFIGDNDGESAGTGLISAANIEGDNFYRRKRRDKNRGDSIIT